MTSPFDLTGRTVLVTGATGGLGRETAVVLSELGARVIATGRSEAKLAETIARLKGSGHAGAAFDLQQIELIPGWVRGLAEQHGPLYGLVHSAGVSWPQPLRTWMLKVSEDLMRINVTAGIALAKGFRHPKVRAEGGSIVLLSSIAGLVGAPGLLDYSASKGAIIAMTRALGAELGREGLRVNCVAPGVVMDVGMLVDDYHLSDEQKEGIGPKTPLGNGRGADVAHAVAFLISPAARWITGTCLTVDGGQSIV